MKSIARMDEGLQISFEEFEETKTSYEGKTRTEQYNYKGTKPAAYDARAIVTSISETCLSGMLIM